jgi:hypothetical protein
MAKAKQIRKALKKEFAPLRKALESIEIRLKAIEKRRSWRPNGRSLRLRSQPR